MKKFYLFPLFFFSLHCYAQREFDKWYFGTNNGISFVSGSPVNFTGGMLNTLEGCSSISDSAGNTLFYTDGRTVYNANNMIMPNGSGLLGGSSSTQSALIVPDPANAKQYYLFTVDQFLGANGFRYSIVDMSLQAGLGDVTTVKNVLLLGVCDEKLTAVRQSSCGGGYWIIVHGNSKISNSYYAYPLTASGIGTPVISSVGPLFNSANSYIGYLKVSPDGSHIARAIYSSGQAEIADFDLTTGIVSNPFTFSAVTTDKMYGVEFSATGYVLYLMSGDIAPTKLFQFDMLAGNSAAILASAVLIDSTPGERGMSLLRARDNKIYATHPATLYLGIINNPEVLGLGCNYVPHGFTLLTNTQIGLPNMICGSLATSGGGLLSSFSSSDSVFCDEGGRCIDFFDQSTCGPTSWKWYFPGAVPDSSDLQNPVNICYYNPGTYAVTLIASNASGSDTLMVSPKIIFGSGATLPVLTLSNDTITCSHASHYQWYFNGGPIPGATDSFYVAINDGTYNVYITDSLGCSRFGSGILFVGMNEITNGVGIKIYPNPAGEILIISHRSLSIDEIGIYNIVGEKIYSHKPESVSTKQESLDVTSWGNGIYMLQIHSGAQVINKKFVVLHK